MQGQGFRDRASDFAAANCVVLGASFDTVADQLAFAESESFPYQLLSDADREVGRAYDAERAEGEAYFELGLPRRVSYLIAPDQTIAANYDLTGQDLSLHAGQILDDIAAHSGP